MSTFYNLLLNQGKTWEGEPPLTCNGSKEKKCKNYQVHGKTEYGKVLPDEYTQLTYIQSTGTQYIDTGIVPSNRKIGMILDFQLTSFNSLDQISGSFVTENVDNFQCAVFLDGSTVKWRWKLANASGYGGACDTNRHTMYFNTNDGVVLDSTTFTSTQYTIPSSNNRSIYLFSRNTNSGVRNSSAKVYSCKYYDYTTVATGELITHYIPARRKSDNALGMYDLVSNTFKTNAGTGTFTAGTAYPAYPTPERPYELLSVGDPILPREYTQLSYITFDGASYIDTGLTTIKNTYTFKFSAKANTANTTFIFGKNPSSPTVNQLGMWVNVSNAPVWQYGANRITGSSILLISTFKDIVATNGRLTVGGNTLSSGTLAESTYTYDFVLGAAYTDNVLDARMFNGQIGTFTVLDSSNNVLLNLVPCKRNSDNTLGFYDTVTSSFKTNQGTGTLTAGDESVTYKIPVVISKNAIPTDYTELEYIESTGKQYIDTGIRANPAHTNTKMKVMLTDVSGTTGLFGARGGTSASGTSYTIFGHVTGANGRFDNVNPSYPYAFTANTWYDIELGHNGLKGTVSINGNLITTGGNDMTDTDVGNIYIGALNNVGTALNVKTPSKWGCVEIYADGTTLSGKFIPCRRKSDNTLGMYDLVSNTFKTNAGSGTFTPGAELSTTTDIYLDAPLRQVVSADGTTVLATDYIDYKTQQVVRNVWAKQFDGTETFVNNLTANVWTYNTIIDSDTTFTDITAICSHYRSTATLPTLTNRQGYAFTSAPSSGDGKYIVFGSTTAYPTLAKFQAFLATQKSNNTPVTAFSFLATPTTEPVTLPDINLLSGSTTVSVGTEVNPSWVVIKQ